MDTHPLRTSVALQSYDNIFSSPLKAIQIILAMSWLSSGVQGGSSKIYTDEDDTRGSLTEEYRAFERAGKAPMLLFRIRYEEQQKLR